MTVRRGFAKEKPKTLKRFLRALIEATDMANADPAAAAAAFQKVTRSSAADAKAALNDYKLRIWLDKSYYDTLQEVSAFKKKLGHIKQIPDWKKHHRCELPPGGGRLKGERTSRTSTERAKGGMGGLRIGGTIAIYTLSVAIFLMAWWGFTFVFPPIFLPSPLATMR